MSEVNERTQRTSLLRGPVEDIPGLTVYLATNFLPLAGGTISGELFIASGGGLYLYDASAEADVQISVDDGHLLVGGVIFLDNNSTLDASKLGVGTVPDARLSANVPLKNAASNAFTGNQTLPLGSVSSPAIQPAGSTNSGLYWVSATNLSVAVSGAERFRFGSTGLFSALEGIALGTIVAPDVRYTRNATGPTAETRAAGGLRVANADGSALGPVACSTGSFGGTVTIGGSTNANLECRNSANSLYVQCNATTRAFYAGGDAFAVLTSDGTSRLYDVGVLGWNTGNIASSGALSGTISRASADTLQIGSNGRNALGSLNLANLTMSGSYRPGQYTVATLPSAAANTGRTVQVTDSSVDFPGNIGNTVAGGGAFNVDVKSNGTNWRITG